MEILQMTWSDFKCFHGSHTIDFREFGPGLYYLAGKNYLDGDLGQNGVGKSTVWDILHWCWFGTSLRGTKTTQLTPWYNPGKPVVQTLMRNNGSIAKITRSYKPNRIILRTKGKTRDVTQEQLEDFIGLTTDTFRHSIVIDQFSRMFFELKPREKLDIFTELLDLDYWLVKSSEASGVVRVIKDDLQELEQGLSGLEGSRKELQRSFNQLRRERESEPEYKSLEELRSNLSYYRKKHRIASRKIEELDLLLVAKRKNDKILAGKIGPLAVRVTELTNLLRSQNSQLADIKSRISSEKKLLAEFIDPASSVCPTCGQTITERHRKREAGKIRQRLENLKQRLKTLHYDETVLERDQDINKLETLKEKLDKEHSFKTQHELDSVKKEADAYESVVKSSREQIKYTKEHDEAHQEKIDKCITRLADNRQKRSETRQQLLEARIVADRAGHWVKGFKDIRLFEIADAIQSLEVEVNSYLSDLGMERWEVKMEVEKETKKGNISKGLSIMVDPGAGSGAGVKPWEAWSGGEGQRLALSGTLGLSEMILRHLNTNSNIQVWDEKFTYLSGSGEDDILELLQEIAKRENRQIWVINQHNTDFNFDGVVTVIKDRNGSRLEF